MNATPQTTDNASNSRDQTELVNLIRQLALVAESNLPPDEKLSLLCTQIGTALFWAERIGAGRQADHSVQGPHWTPTPVAGQSHRVPLDADADADNSY